MKGDVRNAAPEIQQDLDYATDKMNALGFSLKKSKLNEMLSVMKQFFDGFVHIGQRRVLLLFFKAGIHLGLPAA
jgi:hypothetical protein